MKKRPTPQEPRPSQSHGRGTSGWPPREKLWWTTTAAAAMPRSTSSPGSHAPVPASALEAFAVGVALCGPIAGTVRDSDTFGVSDLVKDPDPFRVAEQLRPPRPRVVQHDLARRQPVEERLDGLQAAQLRVTDRGREAAEARHRVT